MVRSVCFISSQWLLLLVVGGITPVLLNAQPRSRTSEPVNDQVVVPLKGNVHPLAQSRFDQGAPPDSFPAPHRLLVLERSAEREAAPRGQATTGNTSTITITPANGFTGNIYFSCTIEYYPPEAQQLPTSNVSTSVNLAGTSPITARRTINSIAASKAALARLHKPERWLLAQLAVLIGAFSLVGGPRGRARRPFVTSLVVIGMTAGFEGCGGGGTNGNKTTPVPGTTPGNYTFMLEGSFTAQIGSTQPQFLRVNVTIH